MLLLILAPLLGVLAGWLLFRHARPLPRTASPAAPQRDLSIVIPARNEAHNLPTLLASINKSTVRAAEVLVVDDHSTDATAEIARSFGATVLPSASLPSGWTGKTWACAQGARAARGSLLLFLDADTALDPDGLARLLAHFDRLPRPAAVSLIPYTRTRKPYEELSLFFFLIMAAGAGGFSSLVPQDLFGQSLLVDRTLYDSVGGHSAVRQHVLENLHLAPVLRAAGGFTAAAIGDGVLSMRMFPEGPAQLIEGWRKGFAGGAAHTPALTVTLVSLWLASCVMAIVSLLLTLFVALPTLVALRPLAALVYLVAATQIFLLARRLGSFRWTTAVLYPIALAFYLGLFVSSVRARRSGAGATWKGRRV